uniref:Uncharacterized protein n=1 Tax=Peronospora matthiolae TaxID=2874970 RepID=A0AAV1V2L7_9STRA
MTKKKEVKTPALIPATLQTEEWKRGFNEQEKELLESSITSVNGFSQELQRVRKAMKEAPARDE